MKRLRILFGAGAILAGCATAPPPEVAAPVPPPAMPEPPAACAACVDRGDEIARLRQDLASRESELRDLRASQREQAKAVQQSTREVTRAKARIRRLATQADAASYLAEVEVAQQAARGAPSASQSPLLALSQAFIDAAAPPFAQGDYATAMDRAAQAEQLIAAAGDTLPAASRPRVTGEVLLQTGIPLKAGMDVRLRREPVQRGAVVAVLRKDSALVAHAYKGTWMRVETEDGKFGWLPQVDLAAR